MVRIDTDGRIYVADREVTQHEAINIASVLAQAVQTSINRNQIDTPGYHDTEQILARQQSPLGKAILALNRIYG